MQNAKTLIRKNALLASALIWRETRKRDVYVLIAIAESSAHFSGALGGSPLRPWKTGETVTL
jgi:hypothetical protein